MSDGATIGIVGGGQLGRMLTLAAAPLGFKVCVINPEVHSPAAQVGADEIVADLYDPKAIHELAKRADFLTVETEHLDAKTLKSLAAHGVTVNPSPETLLMIQDKYLQKEALQKAGIPTAPFVEITDQASAEKALKKFGKMLIKTRHGGFDGRGNMVIRNKADIATAFQTFSGRALYAEKFVPFIKEMAVIVARSTSGQISFYPVVETIHERNICIEVHAPAAVSEAIRKKARVIARRVTLALLKGAGVFAIELFLTKDGKVLVNEIAPRVHNSGHLSIEAFRTSQFEQHVRAVTGLPLGDTSLMVPAAVMINILGERNGQTEFQGIEKALDVPGVSVHIYGKSPTKIDRKMGHVTATGASLTEALKRARAARKLLQI